MIRFNFVILTAVLVGLVPICSYFNVLAQLRLDLSGAQMTVDGRHQISQ